MHRTHYLVDRRELKPAQAVLTLGIASEMELLRLKTIARVYARGLPPDVAWDDLLQEALTRIISGARQKPEGVTIVAFVAGIMRSLKAEHWRRVLRRTGGRESPRIDLIGKHAPQELDLRDPAPGPERSLMAQQELSAIERLFADDVAVLKIITGLGQGLSAEQIRLAMGISKTEYGTVRKRLRRALLREGLTCDPK
jgi:DNA-directed RNA polymerase specialized sigma24 family protein